MQQGTERRQKGEDLEEDHKGLFTAAEIHRKVRVSFSWLFWRLAADSSFISTHADITRHQAMCSLYQLAFNDDRIRSLFVEIGADQFLHVVHSALMRENNANNDRLMLLSACRQAMVCTEENLIHDLAKELTYLVDPKRSADDVIYAEAIVRWERLVSVCWNG